MSKAKVKHILRRREARSKPYSCRRSSKYATTTKKSSSSANPKQERIVHRAYNAEEYSNNGYDSESSNGIENNCKELAHIT